MKLSVSFYDLKRVVSFIGALTPAKDGLGDPTCAIFDVKGNELSLTVNTNNHIAVSPIPAKVEQMGEAVVRVSDLKALVSSFSSLLSSKKEESDTVRIFLGDFGIKFRASVKKSSGRTVSYVRTIPKMQKKIGNVLITESSDYVYVPSVMLLEALNYIAPSLGVSTTVSGFSGVLLESDKSTLKLVSTNSVTLSESIIKVESDVEYSAVIPNNYISRLYAALMKAGKKVEVGIRVSERMCVVKIDSIYTALPLSVETFPGYKVLLSGDKSFFVVDTKEFVDSIRSLSYYTNKDDNNRVSLKAFSGGLTLSTLSGENDSIMIEQPGGSSIHIDVNLNLMLSIMTKIQSDKVIVSHTDASSPLVIKPYDHTDVSCLYILAPLR